MYRRMNSDNPCQGEDLKDSHGFQGGIVYILGHKRLNNYYFRDIRREAEKNSYNILDK